MTVLPAPTFARPDAPRHDLATLALVLGRVPFGWLLQPAAGPAPDAAGPGEPTGGLFPSVDAATRMAIRAGMRAGNW